VEVQEKKADLYERMRQAVMSDKMKEVRSEIDFKRFLSGIEASGFCRKRSAKS